MVSAWQRTMRARFAAYAIGADGQPLKADAYFGNDDARVQAEYQRRTNRTPDGIVSDNDLHKLGVMPTILSVHGTGQPDPFGVGYPADIARRCLDLFWWQPVGNWPAKAIPMNESADAGERELVRLISDRTIVPGPFAIVDYSQGSIIGGRVRDRLRNGDLKARYKDFIGSASFGNPKRPRGHYAGNVDPGGEGLDPDPEDYASEPFCLNLAAPGDIYTTCPGGPVGEMMRAIFNAVFSKFIGKDTLAEQLWELAKNPWSEVGAMWRAIWIGGMFIAQNPPTAPHVTYHERECPGTGQTYYEHAVTHMRGIGARHLANLHAAA